MAVKKAKAKRRTVELHVRVEPKMRDDLDLLAIAAGTTRNALVRLALADYIDRALGKGT